MYEKRFEDIKGVIRSRKSKKDRQHNRQKKKKDRCFSFCLLVIVLSDLQFMAFDYPFGIVRVFVFFSQTNTSTEHKKASEKFSLAPYVTSMH